MKFLIDANLSPRIARRLTSEGHEAAHVADVDLLTASDPDILAHAEAQGQVIVTADTDFPTLVALRSMTTPSVVLMRAVADLTVDRHIDLLLTNLPTVADDLRSGAIVTISPERIRIRDLPIR
ncbi:MAG: DUF5615 family PIN-like protein [Acidimicrobiia bacterium]|nr:DUF5615 family PIN-like protein [Acidimicrobiia bacterium]